MNSIIPPSALVRLQEIDKLVQICRYDEQHHCRSSLSPAEFRNLQRMRVKQFNFLVEKLYEDITLFLVQNL